MGTQKRAQPELLAAKLLRIRKRLGLTQPQMLDSLKLKSGHTVGRISEYEHGIREPNRIVLLQYARAAHVSTDELIDDDIEVDDLRIVKARVIQGKSKNAEASRMPLTRAFVADIRYLKKAGS